MRRLVLIIHILAVVPVLITACRPEHSNSYDRVAGADPGRIVALKEILEDTPALTACQPSAFRYVKRVKGNLLATVEGDRLLSFADVRASEPIDVRLRDGKRLVADALLAAYPKGIVEIDVVSSGWLVRSRLCPSLPRDLVVVEKIHRPM